MSYVNRSEITRTNTKPRWLLGRRLKMSIATDSSDTLARNNVRGRAFLKKAHPIFCARDTFADGVSDVYSLLRPVEASGYSAVKTCLPRMTCQCRMVRQSEHTHTKIAREYDLKKVGLTRVDAEKHCVKVLKEHIVRPEFCCQNRFDKNIPVPVPQGSWRLSMPLEPVPRRDF